TSFQYFLGSTLWILQSFQSLFNSRTFVCLESRSMSDYCIQRNSSLLSNLQEGRCSSNGSIVEFDGIIRPDFCSVSQRDTISYRNITEILPCTINHLNAML